MFQTAKGLSILSNSHRDVPPCLPSIAVALEKQTQALQRHKDSYTFMLLQGLCAGILVFFGCQRVIQFSRRMPWMRCRWVLFSLTSTAPADTALQPIRRSKSSMTSPSLLSLAFS